MGFLRCKSGNENKGLFIVHRAIDEAIMETCVRILDSMGCFLEWPGLKSDQKIVSEQTLTNQSPDRLSIMAKRD